jgi:hypothetical protein
MTAETVAEGVNLATAQNCSQSAANLCKNLIIMQFT